MESAPQPHHRKGFEKLMGQDVDTREDAVKVVNDVFDALDAAHEEGNDIEARNLEERNRLFDITQEESLIYLKEINDRHFSEDYSGEVSPNGNLFDKEGKESHYPSNLVFGEGLRIVQERVNKRTGMKEDFFGITKKLQ